MRRIVPLAVITAPEALALRFALEAEDGDRISTTLACIDGWLAPTSEGRSCILELRATPPVRWDETTAITTNEIRHALAVLGGSLARQLSHDVRGVPRTRPRHSRHSRLPDTARSEP